MKVIAHVDQHVIRRNTKNGTTDPALTVKTYKTNDRAYRASFDGHVELVHSPDKPLSCGARIWLESEDQVTLYAADGSVIRVINPQTKITEE